MTRGTEPASSVGAAERPLVTVLVPVYEAERFLRESLDSILAQDYAPVEVLVLDDCSTDGSAQVLAGYDDAITVVRWSRNRGQFQSQNEGLRLARGELVAVYHADDVFNPDLLSEQVAFLQEHPSVGAVFSSDVWIDEHGRETGRLRLPPDIPADQPLEHGTVLNGLLRHKNTFLRCPSLLVRRQVHDVVGDYRPDLHGIAADLDMFLRISEVYDLAVLGRHGFRYRRWTGAVNVGYHRLRTDVERFFPILDEHLQQCRTSVVPQSLAAYEAHRSEDLLMVAVNRYIVSGSGEARQALSGVSARALASSGAVHRVRLLVLLLALDAVTRLPRLSPVAGLLQRHWHGTGAAAPPVR